MSGEPGNNDYEISWDDNSQVFGILDIRYAVFESYTPPGGSLGAYQVIDVTAPNVTSKTFSNAAPGIYYYIIAAILADGTGGWSGFTPATLAHVTPARMRVAITYTPEYDTGKFLGAEIFLNGLGPSLPGARDLMEDQWGGTVEMNVVSVDQVSSDLEFCGNTASGNYNTGAAVLNAIQSEEVYDIRQMSQADVVVGFQSELTPSNLEFIGGGPNDVVCGSALRAFSDSSGFQPNSNGVDLSSRLTHFYAAVADGPNCGPTNDVIAANHEIGHLHGLYHQNPQVGFRPWSRAIRTGAIWASLMANGLGTSQIYRSQLSNPTKSFGTFFTDNVRVMEETVQSIAQYFPGTYTPPFGFEPNLCN